MLSGRPVGQAFHHGDGPPHADVASSLELHPAFCMAAYAWLEKATHSRRSDADKDVLCASKMRLRYTLLAPELAAKLGRFQSSIFKETKRMLFKD